MGFAPPPAHVGSNRGAAKIASSGEAIVIDLVELTFIGSESLGAFLVASECPETKGHELLVLSRTRSFGGDPCSPARSFSRRRGSISVLEEDVLNSDPAEE